MTGRSMRRVVRLDQDGVLRLTKVASVADPDPWRCRLREVLHSSPGPERLASVQHLARSTRVDELPAVSIQLLGVSLLGLGDAKSAEKVLRDGQRFYPNDTWLNYALATCLERMARRDEAIRYYVAARCFGPRRLTLWPTLLRRRARPTRRSSSSKTCGGFARTTGSSSTALPMRCNVVAEPRRPTSFSTA